MAWKRTAIHIGDPDDSTEPGIRTEDGHVVITTDVTAEEIEVYIHPSLFDDIRQAIDRLNGERELGPREDDPPPEHIPPVENAARLQNHLDYWLQLRHNSTTGTEAYMRSHLSASHGFAGAFSWEMDMNGLRDVHLHAHRNEGTT